jgi:hypothetical protein
LPFHGIFKNLLKIILHSANLATAFIEVWRSVCTVLYQLCDLEHATCFSEFQLFNYKTIIVKFGRTASLDFMRFNKENTACFVPVLFCLFSSARSH